MINVMNPSEKSLKELENCLDPQLWQACAGGMVQMPPINSKVFYFPQGHIEHAQINVDLKTYPKILALIPCRISSIKYLADQETDEVFAKIRLIPLRETMFDFNDDVGLVGTNDVSEGLEKPASFAKTLTQSDANNGGGFSVPRYCAETIFPRLDYSAEPPVQTILAKDVHGVTWKFRHIYRGTPRRHLLTTGWSNFVNQKKLVAGDSIVFLRAENGDLCVGIRRAKRGIGELPSGWNANCGTPYGFLRDEECKLVRNHSSVSNGNGKVRPECVVEGARLAASGHPFEVVYYPRASTPEFCVKASAVRAAMQVQWCAGMRFKMAFETEDSSRISWFMGTVSSVQVADPIHWPNSPWRLLMVAWDEPDLLQNVKRVNPWLVELVATMPTIHMSPFSPPRKKMRLPQAPDFPFVDQLPMPSGPLFGLPDKVPAGVQGARHSQFGHFLSDLHLSKLSSGVFPHGPGPSPKFSSANFLPKPKISDNFLTMGIPDQEPRKDDSKVPKFMLFGKPILTEQQMSQSSSGDSTGSSTSGNLSSACIGTVDSSSGEASRSGKDHRVTKLGVGSGTFKVFTEPEDADPTLGLSALGSYEDLYKKIAQHVWQGKVREAEQCAL